MALANDLAAILQDRFLKLRRNEKFELMDERSKMRVQIVGVSAAVAQIRLEKVGHVPGLKGGVKGQKICDYALLAESDDTIHAGTLRSARSLAPRFRFPCSCPA